MDSRVAYLPDPLAGVELKLPQFEERLPWVGGDLQTMRNFLRRRSVDLSPFGVERVVLPLDGERGDRALGSLHRPLDAKVRHPLVALIHGLNGCEDSHYMRATAVHLLSAGFPVLRLNLRGAGPSRALCRARYHAGRSEDLGRALTALPAHLVANSLVAVGYSLGGNLLLKHLGEVEARTPLLAAAAVSAPIDLTATAHRIMAPRNAFYHWYFLRECQADVATSDAATEEERRVSAAARSLWEFDERVTAPRNGFAGAADYYARASAQKFLDGVAVPTLLIHADDDPIVPSDPYREHRWHRNHRLVPAVQRKGGHVGFHDRRGGTWHDRAIQTFLERALSLS